MYVKEYSTHHQEAGNADDHARDTGRGRLCVEGGDLVLDLLEGQGLNSTPIKFYSLWTRKKKDATYDQLLRDSSRAEDGCALPGQHGDIALVKRKGARSDLEDRDSQPA